MRRLVIGVLMLAGLAAAGPAAAQYTGTAIKSKPPATLRQTQDETQWIIYDSSRCAVQKRPAMASEFVRAPAAEQARIWRKLRTYFSQCLGRASQVRLDLETISGGLANGLYLERYATSPAPFDLEGAKTFRLGKYEQDRASLLGAVSDCVVHRDWAGSTALLRTNNLQGGEAEAFRALGPALSACFPAGSQLKVDKLSLRGAIARGVLASFMAPAQPEK